MSKDLTPLKAIRAFCLGCVGDSPKEVKMCPATNCPLYQFRFGKSLRRSKQRSEAQRAAFEKMLAEKAEKIRAETKKEQHR